MAGLDGVRELVLQAEDQLLLSSKPISNFRVRVTCMRGLVVQVPVRHAHYCKKSA